MRSCAKPIAAPAPIVTVQPLSNRDNVDGSVHHVTTFALGGAGAWLDDDGTFDVTVNGVYHAPQDVPAMRDAIALVESPAFRTARARLEAGVTALPQSRKAA